MNRESSQCKTQNSKPKQFVGDNSKSEPPDPPEPIPVEVKPLALDSGWHFCHFLSVSHRQFLIETP